MIRRSCAALFVALMLACSSTAIHAQVKPAPAKAPVLKPLDINSASEEDIVAVGIDKATAKKIIESRPYRNKTELVSRMLLTRDQYNKLKDALVARQPPKTTSK